MQLWHLWVVEEKRNRVGSYEVARMPRPTRGWEEKMCGFCRFSLRNYFAVFKVCAYVEEES